MGKQNFTTKGTVICIVYAAWVVTIIVLTYNVKSDWSDTTKDLDDIDLQGLMQVIDDWEVGFVNDINVVNADHPNGCQSLDTKWPTSSFDNEDLFMFPWYGIRSLYYSEGGTYEEEPCTDAE